MYVALWQLSEFCIVPGNHERLSLLMDKFTDPRILIMVYVIYF